MELPLSSLDDDPNIVVALPSLAWSLVVVITKCSSSFMVVLGLADI